MAYTCRYFNDREFTCHCGCGFNNACARIKMIADDIRQHFGRPMIITSGVRCVAHNRRVGGVANSQHCQGNAIDFVINGVSQQQLLAYCQTLRNQGRAGYTYAIPGTNAVHIDVGPRR